MDHASEDQAFRSAMLGAARSFVEGIAAHDANAAAVAYSSSARLLAPSVEPIEGRDGITAFWRAGIEAGIRDVERVTVHAENHGSVAVEYGRYAIQVVPSEGDVLVDRGKYLLVHQRQDDGAWLWAVEILSPDGPPEASAPAPVDWSEEAADD